MLSNHSVIYTSLSKCSCANMLVNMQMCVFLRAGCCGSGIRTGSAVRKGASQPQGQRGSCTLQEACVMQSVGNVFPCKWKEGKKVLG